MWHIVPQVCCVESVMVRIREWVLSWMSVSPAVMLQDCSFWYWVCWYIVWSIDPIQMFHSSPHMQSLLMLWCLLYSLYWTNHYHHGHIPSSSTYRLYRSATSNKEYIVTHLVVLCIHNYKPTSQEWSHMQYYTHSYTMHKTLFSGLRVCCTTDVHITCLLQLASYASLNFPESFNHVGKYVSYNTIGLVTSNCIVVVL